MESWNRITFLSPISFSKLLLQSVDGKLIMANIPSWIAWWYSSCNVLHFEKIKSLVFEDTRLRKTSLCFSLPLYSVIEVFPPLPWETLRRTRCRSPQKHLGPQTNIKIHAKSHHWTDTSFQHSCWITEITAPKCRNNRRKKKAAGMTVTLCADVCSML